MNENGYDGLVEDGLAEGESDQRHSVSDAAGQHPHHHDRLRWKAGALASVCAYFGAAVLVYPQFEDWTTLETFYFSVEVLTTVGYGDIAPTNTTTRLFAIFHILFGLVVTLSVVGEIMGDVVEQFFDNVVDAIHTTIHDEADTDSKMSNFIQRCVILVMLIVMGASAFHFLEDLNWVDCFYFCIVTVTTIGLGDVTPKTEKGRMFAIFWMLGGVTAMGWTVSAFSEMLLERMRHTFHDQLMIDHDNLVAVGGEDGSVNRAEFYKHYIMQKGFMDEKQFELMEENFNKLDVNGDGEINLDDFNLGPAGLQASPEPPRGVA